jgi:mediator of RNA polymerase II transcription subunit 21
MTSSQNAASNLSAGPSKLAQTMVAEPMKNGDENGIEKDEEEEENKNTQQSGTSIDLISQLESDLALMLQIMTSSLHFLTHRSAHVQINSKIPLFQPTNLVQSNAANHLIEEKIMSENIDELTDDLILKAKEMEGLLQRLPKQTNEQSIKQELQQIDQEMIVANKEYRDALRDAGENLGYGN